MQKAAPQRTSSSSQPEPQPAATTTPSAAVCGFGAEHSLWLLVHVEVFMAHVRRRQRAHNIIECVANRQHPSHVSTLTPAAADRNRAQLIGSETPLGAKCYGFIGPHNMRSTP